MRCIAYGLCVVPLISLVGCQLSQPKTGSSFYPIGIYSVPSTNDFASLEQAGFNLVVGLAERPRLDAARDARLKVLAAPDTSAGPGFDPVKARDAVEQLDRHPALWAWYLSDEPDLNGIPPAQVAEACRGLKALGARKPTALVLSRGYEALHYGGLADITMIDRYPIPWLPLANFGQHVTLTRLSLGPHKPLIAVIQAFDWTACPHLLPGEKNLRPPNYAEIRCMTYEALARGANGLFYYAYDAGRWKIRDHPETWAALQSVVLEVRRRLPLFQAEPRWWDKKHDFGDAARRFNAALESSVTSVLLHVASGNQLVPAGDYILAVNNTDQSQEYSFTLPFGETSKEPKAQNRNLSHVSTFNISAFSEVPVLEENRSLTPRNGRATDTFLAYAVHVYGPLNYRRDKQGKPGNKRYSGMPYFKGETPNDKGG